MSAGSAELTPSPKSQSIGRIEILAGQPDEVEAAAIVTALYALRPAASPAPQPAGPSRWKRTALLEAQQRLSQAMESAGRAAAQTLWPG